MIMFIIGIFSLYAAIRLALYDGADDDAHIEAYSDADLARIIDEAERTLAARRAEKQTAEARNA